MFKTYLETTPYLEKILLSEFTFAFEFETYVNIDFLPYNYENEKDTPYIDLARAALKKYMDKMFSNAETIGKNEGYVSLEGSLDEDSKYGTGLEWSSPIFKFSPKNVLYVLKQLQTVKESKAFHINEDCSLHIHVGFPEYETSKDKELNLLWILLNIAVSAALDDDKNILNKISSYKDLKLYDSVYAPRDYLFDMANKIYAYARQNDKDKLIDFLQNYFSVNKLKLIRLHPQGTLEWRGPRGFLNYDQSVDLIREFFIKVLYPFMNWIGKIVDTEIIEIEGITISKKEIYEKIVKYKGILDSSQTFTDNVPKENITKLYKMYEWLRPKSNNIKINDFNFIIRDNMLKVLDGEFNWVIPWKDSIIYQGLFRHCTFDSENIYFSPVTSDRIFIYACEIKNISTATKLKISYSKIRGGKFNLCKMSDTNIFGDNIEIDQCRLNNCFIGKSRIFNSDIEEGEISLQIESKNNNIKKLKILGGLFTNDRLIYNDIYGGNYNSCDLNLNTIYDGKYKQTEFNSCVIKNGSFDDCIFNDCHILIHLKDKIEDLKGTNNTFVTSISS